MLPHPVKEQECYALLLSFSSSVTLRLVTAYVAIPHVVITISRRGIIP